jgi:hypothetical protein
LNLFNELRKDRDLLNKFADGLHDLVMEFHDRVDLLDHLANLLGEGLRLLGCDVQVAHGGSVGVLLELVGLARLVLAAEDAVRKLTQQLLDLALVLCPVSVCDGTLELLQLRLGSLVGNLTAHGVQEVDTTKGTSNDGVNLLARLLDVEASVTTNVGEDVALSHLNQSQLSIVRVCRVVFQAVSRGTKQTQGLVEVRSTSTGASTEINAASQ